MVNTTAKLTTNGSTGPNSKAMLILLPPRAGSTGSTPTIFSSRSMSRRDWGNTDTTPTGALMLDAATPNTMNMHSYTSTNPRAIFLIYLGIILQLIYVLPVYIVQLC